MREMIDTNIGYINNAPVDWSLIPGKSMFSEVKDKNSDGSETTALKFTYGEIVRKENFDASTEEYVAETIKSYNRVKPDDIVINGLNLNYDFVSQRVAIVRESGVITSAYVVVRPNEHINPKFVNYLLKSCDNMKVFHGMGEGVRQTIKFDDLGNMTLVCPTEDEQHAIVAYLDSKCAAIDEAIDRHRKIIEKLEENERSLVFEIITQGLHKRKKLQETDIRWAKRIPAHWTPRRIKYSVEFRNGTDPQTEGDIPVYGSGAKSFKTCGEYKCPPTVLLGRKGATLHIPHYIDHPYWNVDTAFDTKPLNSTNMRWFYYVARCLDYKYFITQTTLPSMTQTDYGNMVVPTPPTTEQAEIADYLDKKTSLLQDAVSRHQAIISKLEEYRKSIIYNAVTGKIDFRTEA